MSNAATNVAPFAAWLLTLVPLLWLGGTALASGFPAAGARWRCAGAAANSALGVAALALMAVLLPALLVASPPGSARAGVVLAGALIIRADLVGALMLLLVSFVGWVIVRYSRRYLAGDPGESRYVPPLLATLAAVSLVVVSNHLVLLALAWVATSLGLHRLLTFYDRRIAALIAAHKKFLASRAADLCLFSAVVLAGQGLGTYEIDRIAAQIGATTTLPAGLQAAAVLFALAAVLKCAQLPFHGWLIQVMEAPTPVSALLHAGIVNLGGFLLIRLAPLIAAVPAAQALLVIAGAATAVLAGLVMTTRISIKVMLAWSTCAQMGFMLMQCGLGLPELAFVHLMAHSLYKAHAFLAAGGAVEQARIQQMAAAGQPVVLATNVFRAACGAAAVAAAAWAWNVPIGDQPGLLLLALIASLALTPLFAFGRGGGVRDWVWPPVAALGIALIYMGVHEAAAAALALQTGGAAAGWLVAIAAGAFLALFVVQSVIAAKPGGRLARTLYPWFYAGFYLDELFTRFSFRLWPVRLPPSPDSTGVSR